MEIPEKSRVWRREENIGKLGKKLRKQKLDWRLIVRGVSISFFSAYFPPFLHCLAFASYVSSEDRISRPSCRGWVEIRARGHNRLWRTRRPPMEECGDESTRHNQPTYGEVCRWVWKSVEMRARDTAGGEDARLWRRREGKTGKEGLRGGENR